MLVERLQYLAQAAWIFLILKLPLQLFHPVGGINVQHFPESTGIPLQRRAVKRACHTAGVSCIQMS